MKEERQRLGSGQRTFSGALSPVQESPEYARTPSTQGSADELESDLNKALLQLDSETTGLKADEKEVEFIEQTAARMTPVQKSGASHSGSPSPFLASTPTTPNTVVWEKGTCVVVSSTPAREEKEEEEEEKAGKQVEERKEKVTEEGKETKEGEREEEVREKEDVEEPVSKTEVFEAIPKVAPTLGLKEGHDRQQLAVARSSTRRRPPTRHSGSKVSEHRVSESQYVCHCSSSCTSSGSQCQVNQ